MFTGLIEATGHVASLEALGEQQSGALGVSLIGPDDLVDETPGPPSPQHGLGIDALLAGRPVLEPMHFDGTVQISSSDAVESIL